MFYLEISRFIFKYVLLRENSLGCLILNKYFIINIHIAINAFIVSLCNQYKRYLV